MGAVRAWARVDVRRWGSLAVLLLLVAVSAGAVLSAATAVHRGVTALGRLEERSLPATVQIPNFDARVDLTKVRTLPYVEAVAPVAGGGIGLLEDGHHGSTEQNSPVDATLFTDVARPVVLDGRLFDPESPDEAVVTPQWAEDMNRGVGDTATVRLPTPRQQATGTEDVPRGPVVTVRIVGIVLAPGFVDWPGAAGRFIPSPGLAATYRANWDTALTNPRCACQWASVGALVRLEHGAADIPELRSDLVQLYPGYSFNLVNLDEDAQVHQHDIVVQSWGLAIFGAAALLASVVLVGQAVARHVVGAADHLRTGQALGFTRSQLVIAAASGPVVAGALGAAIGAGGAVVASRWTPIGVARAVEPSPGVAVDVAILAPGILVAVALIALVAAATVVRSTGTRERTLSARRSRVAAWASRTGLPVPLQVGARLALEPGRARRSLPVTQTVAAVALAVAGTSAALVIDDGVQDALGHPERYGQTFQAVSFVGFGSTDFLDPDQVEAAVAPIDYVDGLALPRQKSAGADNDRVGVALFSYTSGDKPLPTVVLAGRMPEAANEVALAPAALRSLDADVGDPVTLEGDRGSSTLRIVGRVLTPATDNSRYDQGGWVTDAGYDRLFSGFDAHWVLVSTDSSAGSGPALDRRLTEDAAATLGAGWARTAAFDEMGTTGLTTEPLRQVRWFPTALGGLVVLLAVAALAHAGAAAIRRRAGDLANLRALGMTRAGVSLTVVAQGAVLAGTGLLVGLPVGAALGRTLWRAIADGVPLELVPPSLGVLWLVGPAAVAVAVVLAVVPAVRAARLPVADLLRAE
ncbi:MAG TPA: FtsX-like permease family protein [Nocardioides sp.]|nr:FtsX-like permease family protein [Nocardioides sp.]